MSNVTNASDPQPTLFQLIVLNVVVSTLTLWFWTGVGVMWSWI